MVDQKLVCNISGTILDALQAINANAKGIVFAIDNNGVLKGILTDGDIRRLLLNGTKLNDALSGLLNEKFVYAMQGVSLSELISKTNERIKFVPIVDDNMKLVDVFIYNTSYSLPVSMPDLYGNEFNYLVEAFLSSWISSSGKYATIFEQNFAKFCHVRHGVAVSSGVAAVHLALVALGVEKGDEVILPDLTFAATINAVLHAGATPVIVDVNRDDWCISSAEIEKAITKKTKAIIPVHLYGQPCDMTPIMQIAKRYHLYVIEDCAEAHGATIAGRPVGSFGHINCFSFFANKIITTGEGGMCTTDSDELNEKMRVLRSHGMSKKRKYWHDVVGYNYRMTNLQAALGVAQLERISDILKRRSAIEAIYKGNLTGVGNIEFQQNFKNKQKVTWLVSVLTDKEKRDLYIDRFREEGIDVRPFFYPLSHMDIYKKYTFSNANSVEISYRGMNFPTFNQLNEDTLDIFKAILTS